MLIVKDSTLTFTKGFEKCVLTSYPDSRGLPTIGWGARFYPGGDPVLMGQTITQNFADYMIQVTMNHMVYQANHYIKVTPTQNQNDAVVDLLYNIGLEGFLSSTVFRLLNINPSDSGIPPAFLLWDKILVDGQLVESSGLLNRREKESQLYLS